MNRIASIVSILIVGVMLSACASTERKSVVILGENQIVELDGDRTCRVVKAGVRNFRCVPVREIASRPKKQ